MHGNIDPRWPRKQRPDWYKGLFWIIIITLMLAGWYLALHFTLPAGEAMSYDQFMRTW